MAKGKLQKSTTVLQLRRNGAKVSHFLQEGLEKGEVGGIVKDLYMNNEHFDDLGKPSEITVTVEAGDKLNG